MIAVSCFTFNGSVKGFEIHDHYNTVELISSRTEPFIVLRVLAVQRLRDLANELEKRSL